MRTTPYGPATYRPISPKITIATCTVTTLDFRRYRCLPRALFGRDQYHERAQKAWRRLSDERARLLTSNFVLDELFTLLGRRASYTFAAGRARHILTSEELEILRPDTEVEIEAVDLFEKYADQKVSFTDCASFVLMRRHKIRHVFSFDRHFELAGFFLWPPVE